jgi:3-oxoacyl-[acyl-carrier protein] reductase
MLLQGKNALITGCSRGIGKSTLELFAKNGANVFACFRTYDEKYEQYCNSLSEQYKVEVTPLYFEMGNYDQIKAGLKTVFNNKQDIDILVNNAGVTSNALFNMSSINSIKEVFETNLFSQLYIIQLLSKIMIKHQKGSIINVSSIVGIDGNAGQVAYGASKAGLIGATKSLAKEFVSYGIRVNAVAPGFTETDMLKNVPEKVYENCVGTVNMKRSGTPDEIANTILFLASDMSSYITGQVIRVDGGM